MLSIILNSLDLLNFQGTKSAHYDFNDKESWVCGDNGTGKTTIADAFMWCLFGKNSKGKTDKDFDLKTLDAEGKVVWQQPHEVTATLQVGFEVYKFRRCLCEKWVKQRGSIERTFEGHETNYFVNDVPKSQRDYKAKVAEIISEDTFRSVADPTYFLSLKKDVQRETLLAMYGDVEDKDIADHDPRFGKLLAELTGKTLEEYREQMKAELATIKKSVEIIPVQIEERQRSISEIPDNDYQKARFNLEAYKKQQEIISQQMKDNAARLEVASEQQRKYHEELSRVQAEILAKQTGMRKQLLAEYYKQVSEKETLEREIKNAESVVEMNNKQLALIKHDKENYNNSIFTANDAIKEVMATKYTPVKDDFTCPTCGHVFGADKQKDIYADMLERFNNDKAEKIKSLNERKQMFLDSLADLVEQEKRINSDCIKKNTELGMMRTRLKQYAELPAEAPDVTARIENSEEIRNLKEVEESVKKKITMFNAPQGNDSVDALKEELDMVQGYINDLNAILANEAMIERDRKRIAELTEELKAQSQEMARIEEILQTVYDFRKAKIEAVESKINAQFDIVCWRMFKQQINGGEVEDCEALVGGVPYSRSLNNAARINAGLDIVNAFSRHYNVSAPVFVDNAEASNHFIQMESQRIFLKVTNDKEITIR